MAVHLRLRCTFKFMDDTPKNRAVISPCFRVNGAFTNADSLCSDLADQLGFLPGLGGTPYDVTSYDINGTKPVYPNGQSKRNTAAAIKQPTVVPEASVVLSFFSGVNRPRKRGRLYLPAWLLGATSGDMGRTVPTGLRTAASSLVANFAALGGANVDWIVWSAVDGAASKVSDYFISDMWGIQRRRGIKETARTVGTTSG